MRVRVGEVPLHSITIGGVTAEVHEGVAKARLPDQEGLREVEIHLIDMARNERRFRVDVIVDTTPPAIDWRRPTTDALISTAEIDVEGGSYQRDRSVKSGHALGRMLADALDEAEPIERHFC